MRKKTSRFSDPKATVWQPRGPIAISKKSVIDFDAASGKQVDRAADLFVDAASRYVLVPKRRKKGESPLYRAAVLRAISSRMNERDLDRAGELTLDDFRIAQELAYRQHLPELLAGSQNLAVA